MASRVLWEIDNETSGRDFERLCIDLLHRNGYLDILPIEPQDGGRDAQETPRPGRSSEGHPAFHVLINPEIELLSSPDTTFFEGCLSLPGFVALVPRARKVLVKALNEHAEPVHIDADGWYARILQHEIDHLRGTLYIDRMWSRSFCSLENYTRHWKSKPANKLLQEFEPPCNRD